MSRAAKELGGQIDDLDAQKIDRDQDGVGICLPMETRSSGAPRRIRSFTFNTATGQGWIVGNQEVVLGSARAPKLAHL